MKTLSQVLFILFIGHSLVNAQEHFKIDSPSNWVDVLEFRNSNVDSKEHSYEYILVDNQENTVKEEDYFHYVIQINNSEGVQSMSSISVDFDPSFQEVIFHGITVHRNGVAKKRKISDFNYLQRETDLNRALYDGTITGLKELSDIRPGDILEYSFTIVGYNPIYGNHRFTSFLLDHDVYIRRLRQMLFVDNESEFYFDGTDAKVHKKGPLTIYSWDLDNVEPRFTDKSVPDWIGQRKRIRVSTMKNWKEAGDWAQSLYVISKDDRKKLLQNISKQIKIVANPEGIMRLIRFVQDEIRYLGFEGGINAFKPHSPIRVLSQRFGDCKDKSFLLSSILSEIGVESYPCLVHTSKGNSINDCLPSPHAFNHCIVSFNFENEVYFVDPTNSNQGGDLESFSMPDYKWGLQIGNNSEKLIEIVKSDIPETQMFEVMELDSVGGSAKYFIQTKYLRSKADFQRSYFERTSRAKIKKNYVSYYKNAYPNLEIDSLRIIDSTRNNTNEFIVEEFYTIDKIWDLEGDVYTLTFYNMILEEYMNLVTPLQDSLPYYLGRKKYRNKFEVDLPESWNIENDKTVIANEYFEFEKSIIYRDGKLELVMEYLIKDDSVDPLDVKRVLKDAQRINDNSSYQLTCNKQLVNENLCSAWQAWLAFIIGLSLGGYLAYLVYSNYDPIPSWEGEAIGFGGWLWLPFIGLVVSPFKVLVGLKSFEDEGFFQASTWNAIWYSEYWSLWFVIFAEGIINLFILVFSCLLVLLFIKKRSNFPRVFIAFLLFNCIYLLADNLYVTTIDDAHSIWSKEIIQSIIACIIWVPYFLFSNRVKKTFVNRLSN